MVILSLSMALLCASLIIATNILMPAIIADMTSMVPPAHIICIFSWSEVLEWLLTCLASQFCSRTVNCSLGNVFSPVLFVANVTAKQLSSLDETLHVTGSTNLV